MCSDGIHVEKERPCITERPEGASFDFRDPKVQQVEGKDYMVLGSSLDGVPSILLYVREDGGWSFKGPLLQEHERALQRKEMMGGGLLKHGEAAGTKLFYQDSTEGHLEADFAAGSLNRLEVWTMESIWNHKS